MEDGEGGTFSHSLFRSLFLSLLLCAMGAIYTFLIDLHTNTHAHLFY